MEEYHLNIKTLQLCLWIMLSYHLFFVNVCQGQQINFRCTLQGCQPLKKSLPCLTFIIPCFQIAVSNPLNGFQTIHPSINPSCHQNFLLNFNPNVQLFPPTIFEITNANVKPFQFNTILNELYYSIANVLIFLPFSINHILFEMHKCSINFITSHFGNLFSVNNFWQFEL